MSNRVRFGLSHVHVVDLKEINGVVTYEIPKAIPGAKSLTLDVEGSQTAHRFDNMDYWISNSNKGYTGELEMALIPDWFLESYLGFKKADTGELVELANVSTKPFGLLFQFEGDVNAVRHILYKVVCGRPSQEASTTEDEDEPQTETMPLTISPIMSGPKYVVRGKTTEDTKPTDYESFFTVAPKLPTFTESTPEPEVQG